MARETNDQSKVNDGQFLAALPAEGEVQKPAAPPDIQLQPRTSDQTRPIALQVLESIRQNAPGSFEITLVPEELGRLRLTVTAAETGLTVFLSAERPETLDLMRRSLDILAQEARDQGFGTLEFSFEGSGGHAGHEARDPRPQDGLPGFDGPSDPTPFAPPPPALSGGLDLRL